MEGSSRGRTAARIGVITAFALIAASTIIPAVTGWVVEAGSWPPLHAEWWPHVGIGTVPALVIGALAVLFAAQLTARISWRSLLIGAFLASLVWMLALALIDGPTGLGAILDARSEYLGSARAIDSVPELLREYISRIPIDSPGNWPTHLAGHPPGAALFFWILVRLGLGSWLAAGVVIIVIAATTPVAVLVTLRRLGAGDAARTAAPFLVCGPSAIWSAVSADAMFTAIVAWGLCLLAISATTRVRLTRALWALAAGVVLGLCMFLSYGLPLVGLLAVAILVVARSWRPLPWAAASALTVVVAFAAAGFAWWDAYPVLAARYWDGIAAIRPYGYWVWGNLGALAISAGPIVGSSIAVAAVTITGYRRASIGHRAVVALTLAATFAIVLADLSGMSKAEVERIWLPFMPWMLVGTALLPARWRRGGLAVQIAVALVVQHLFFTRW